MRQAIIDGLYAPGERLREEKLAADLDISPTPIREALLILEAQGLVETWPRRGATVVELTRDDIIDIYRIRNVLEPFATRAAMERLTPYDRGRLLLDLRETHREWADALREDRLEPVPRLNWHFHHLIYSAANSSHLVETIERLWNKLPHYWLRSIPGRAKWAFDQHDEIIAAVEVGDSDVAGKAMSRHISSAAEGLTAYLNGDDFPPASAGHLTAPPA
ncbi:GntR family transcriptional regulator [Rubrobacter marinus]|uniref:GntR family transcriptional regulator n=1 Tax=Rubrobacter marinus TaxID=2653852 RepID=UPI00140BE95D|nr:GntR family transcriptional regulator [Rubrobacter marinus]